jgi:hypothetical protein
MSIDQGIQTEGKNKMSIDQGVQMPEYRKKGLPHKLKKETRARKASSALDQSLQF